MGTNYYLHYNVCECRGRQDSIHIGKCSCGWKFLFHWHPNIRNVKEYKDIMKQEGSYILDEYHQPISYDEFWIMVEEKQNEERHEEFSDIDGYDFVSFDFS